METGEQGNSLMWAGGPGGGVGGPKERTEDVQGTRVKSEVSEALQTEALETQT